MSGALAALIGFSFSGRPTNFGGTIEVSDSDFVVSGVAFMFYGDLLAQVTGAIVVDTVTGDTWFSPNQQGAGSRYWIRATVTSGSTPSSGDINTWLALDTPGGLSWGVSTGSGTVSSTLLFEISSNSGGSNVVASGTVTLTATSSGSSGGGGGGMQQP